MKGVFLQLKSCQIAWMCVSSSEGRIILPHKVFMIQKKAKSLIFSCFLLLQNCSNPLNPGSRRRKWICGGVSVCVCMVARPLGLHHSHDEGSCCPWGRCGETEASEWSNSLKFSELTRLVFSLRPRLLSLAHPLQRCFLKVISVATVFVEAGVRVSGCTETPFMLCEELEQASKNEVLIR